MSAVFIAATGAVLLGGAYYLRQRPAAPRYLRGEFQLLSIEFRYLRLVLCLKLELFFLMRRLQARHFLGMIVANFRYAIGIIFPERRVTQSNSDRSENSGNESGSERRYVLRLYRDDSDDTQQEGQKSSHQYAYIGDYEGLPEERHGDAELVLRLRPLGQSFNPVHSGRIIP